MYKVLQVTVSCSVNIFCNKFVIKLLFCHRYSDLSLKLNAIVGVERGGYISLNVIIWPEGLTTEYRATFEGLSLSSGSSALLRD